MKSKFQKDAMGNSLCNWIALVSDCLDVSVTCYWDDTPFYVSPWQIWETSRRSKSTQSAITTKLIGICHSQSVIWFPSNHFQILSLAHLREKANMSSFFFWKFWSFNCGVHATFHIKIDLGNDLIKELKSSPIFQSQSFSNHDSMVILIGNRIFNSLMIWYPTLHHTI